MHDHPPVSTSHAAGYAPRDRLIPPVLLGFVVLYMIACSAMALMQGNNEFMLYAVIMVIFIVGILALHMRIRFSRTVLWLLAIWGLLHMAGGTLSIPPEYTDAWRAASDPGDRPSQAVLYSLRIHPDLPRYDQIVHVFGFFTAALACFQGLLVLLGAPRALATAFAAALMSIGLGAINEVIEFIAVLSMPETNVGGYTNTAWDLVSNTIGAVAGAIICLMTRPRN